MPDMTSLLLAVGDPTEHIRDVIHFGTEEVPLVTTHMITLILAAILTVLFMHLAANAIQTGPESEDNERFLTRNRFGQIIEAMVAYLRDQMLEPVLGERGTRKFLPFLLTLFFFILANNLIGLIPLLDLQHLFGIHAPLIGGTPTGNIGITAGLALVAGLVIVGAGIADLGPKEFLYHMTGGLLPAESLAMGLVLAPVIVIVFAIEVLGLFIKPAALAIRLFANMVAGHTLLAVLLGFGYMAASQGANWAATGGVSLVTGVFAVLIFFLEIFVAFLQAFIFMFLTAVFISLLQHHEEHEPQEAEHHGVERDDIADAAEHVRAA